MFLYCVHNFYHSNPLTEESLNLWQLTDQQNSSFLSSLTHTFLSSKLFCSRHSTTQFPLPEIPMSLPLPLLLPTEVDFHLCFTLSMNRTFRHPSVPFKSPSFTVVPVSLFVLSPKIATVHLESPLLTDKLRL